MAALNNLKGHIVKEGKIVYSEKLEDDLYFTVIMKYEPFFDEIHHKNSSQLVCEACVTTGNIKSYSNGVKALEPATVVEKIRVDEKFKQLRKEFKTKDGFRVWQKDYMYDDYEEELESGEKIKVKARKVIWIVEVPKLSLLKFCQDESVKEDNQNYAQTSFLQGLLKRILKGQHEVIDTALRDEVVSKSHILQVFNDLAIYEEELKF